MNISDSLTDTKMKKLEKIAERIAKYPTTVLIEGETGVGKEVMAAHIHQCSGRKTMPFIKINCGAIPEGLIESELFGYEKGAFTGAKRDGNPGLFELAHKGTLLLDEIGELSNSMQVKVLRVLQDREIRRVGGSWSKSIDVRIIASTNQNLLELVSENRFRKDLYYRLNIAYIHVPPLRERRSEIEPLAKLFVSNNNEEFGLNKWLNSDTISLLKEYDYPGNIRELRNILEVMCILSDTDEITPSSLPAYIKPTLDKKEKGLEYMVEELEKREIIKALQSEKSIRQAAAQLKISNATMLRKMKKYSLHA